jgi:flavin reductase (DIM6/NTAB) family NADH-FMN oxidoreductase RutF
MKEPDMTSPERHLDPQDLRHAYAQFPTGVVAIAAEIDGAQVGLAASSFVPVSLDPPLVAFCIQNTSSTWPILRRAPFLGVSVLSSVHDGAAHRLGLKTGNRFDGLGIKTAENGAILVRGASAWLQTSVATSVPAGDHVIVLLRVHALGADTTVDPLVFHGSKFRHLLDAASR